MKNVEKFQRTKDAVKAWDAYHDGGGDMPFTTWAEQEVVLPTLLKAAEAVKTTWDSQWQYGSLSIVGKTISNLSDAIDREKAKPVRNVDRFATAEEAFGAFSEICNAHKKCIGCPMEKIKAVNASYAHCMMCWLYANADKDVDVK